MKLLGKTLVDVVTGFSGVATGYVTYLTGCNQYLVVPKCKNDEMQQGEWIDEGRLNVTNRGRSVTINDTEVPGGDISPTKRL